MKKNIFLSLLLICSAIYCYSQNPISLKQSENEILRLNNVVFRKASKRIEVDKSRIKYFHILRVEFPIFSDSLVSDSVDLFQNHQIKRNCKWRISSNSNCKLATESFIYSDEGILLYYWNGIGKSSADGRNSFGLSFNYAETLFDSIAQNFEYAFIPIVNNMIPLGCLFVLTNNDDLVFYVLEDKSWIIRDKDYFIEYLP